MPVLSRSASNLILARAMEVLAARQAGQPTLSDTATAREALRDLPDQPLSPRPGPAGAERTCAAPGCMGRWSLPWKSRRRRPIFEGDWGCSSACLTTLVQVAVRREIGDSARDADDAPHRHRVPLGLVLLAQGWITHPQLQTALEAQRASGRGRIGDWLSQSCGLEEERIARGLGVQWSCPVLSSEGFSASAMALVMPKRFVAEFNLVPLRVAGNSLLYLAFEERMNAAAALAVEMISGLKVENGLLPSRQFEAARAAILAADAVPVDMKLVPDRDALAQNIVRTLTHYQPLATRLVRVHNYYWLRMWLETAALQGTGNLPRSPEDMRDCLFMLGR